MIKSRIWIESSDKLSTIYNRGGTHYLLFDRFVLCLPLFHCFFSYCRQQPKRQESKTGTSEFWLSSLLRPKTQITQLKLVTINMNNTLDGDLSIEIHEIIHNFNSKIRQLYTRASTFDDSTFLTRCTESSLQL